LRYFNYDAISKKLTPLNALVIEGLKKCYIPKTYEGYKNFLQYNLDLIRNNDKVRGWSFERAFVDDLKSQIGKTLELRIKKVKN